jgi:hypothetical protein
MGQQVFCFFLIIWTNSVEIRIMASVVTQIGGLADNILVWSQNESLKSMIE